MEEVDSFEYKVRAERLRQERKWGVQNHELPIWMLILGEEFGELQKAILEMRGTSMSGIRYQAINKELVQIAAVCKAIDDYMIRQY